MVTSVFNPPPSKENRPEKPTPSPPQKGFVGVKSKNKTPKVRIDIDVPGQGKEAHEYDNCPIKMRWRKPVEHLNTNECPLCIAIKCEYGLSDWDIPKSCPLKHGVKMEFSIVRNSK